MLGNVPRASPAVFVVMGAVDVQRRGVERKGLACGESKASDLPAPLGDILVTGMHRSRQERCTGEVGEE